jgi:2-(1,2-epoxy-1,2-dihydrophenyl)acetyl-CoA isomerase
MTQPVLVEIEGAVATIRLNEPESRNALSGAMRDILEERVPVLAVDDAVRCILITGEGRAFCAGGDIRTFAQQQSPSAIRKRIARSHAWIAALLTCEKPVVTAVNGAAVGAGFGLAMLGDIVIASERAWFMGGFNTIGVAADYALGRTLPRAVGAVRAKDIIMTGRKVEAQEAFQIGIASRLVPEATFHDEAMALARSLADAPTVGIGLTKSLVDAGFNHNVPGYLHLEAHAQGVTFNSQDHRAGVEAFLAKQPLPPFTGR